MMNQKLLPRCMEKHKLCAPPIPRRGSGQSWSTRTLPRRKATPFRISRQAYWREHKKCLHRCLHRLTLCKFVSDGRERKRLDFASSDETREAQKRPTADFPVVHLQPLGHLSVHASSDRYGAAGTHFVCKPLIDKWLASICWHRQIHQLSMKLPQCCQVF